MKFVVAVVMLALAVGVQSSLIPYAAHYAPAVSYVSSVAHHGGHYGGHYDGGHYDDGHWDGHYDDGHWDGHYGGHHYGPAAVAVHHGAYGAWGHGGHWGYPGISLSQGPHAAHAAPLVHAHGLGHGHGHEGVYVAKTRGAVHTAPLAGHLASATSLNVAPAPGTH